MKEILKCSGIKTSGAFKGCQCCAHPTYQTEDKKLWCKNHLPINQKSVKITP